MFTRFRTGNAGHSEGVYLVQVGYSWLPEHANYVRSKGPLSLSDALGAATAILSNPLRDDIESLVHVVEYLIMGDTSPGAIGGSELRTLIGTAGGSGPQEYVTTRPPLCSRATVRSHHL